MAGELKPNSTLTMFITHVRTQENWLKFWAQTDLQTARCIESALSSRRQEFESSAGFLHSCQLPPDDIFCSRFEDGNWHRVRILQPQPNNPQAVVVHFIDYGNKQTVSVADVRKLDDYQLLNYPQQAIECYLADIRAPQQGTWPPTTIKFCEEHLQYQHLSGLVIGQFDKYPIIRLYSRENTIFAHMLVNLGLAKPTEPINSVATSSTGTYCGEPYQVGVLNTGQAYRVYVSNIISPQKFFIQMTIEESHRTALLVSLEEAASKRALIPVDHVALGLPCVAKCVEDGQYQRGIFMGMSSNNRCNILFVDTGISELVPVAKLYTLPAHLKILPVQAFECSLGAKATFSAAAFQTVTEGKVLDCKIIDQIGIERGTFTYIVTLSYRGVDISHVIGANMLPRHLVYARFRYPKLKEKMTYEICVTVIKSLTNFYCRLAQNIPQYNHMIAALENQYSNSLSEPVMEEECLPGQAVCVRIASDDSWYRGEILSECKGGKVQIKFSDYGNIEFVSLSDLRKLTSIFVELPAQAIHLSLKSLENIPEEQISHPEVLQRFQSLTENRSLMVEVIETIQDKHWSVVLHGGKMGTLNKEMLSFIETQSDMSVKQPDLKSVESLYVSAVISKNEFFGQLHRYPVSVMDKLLEELERYYSNLSPKPSRLELGQMVCTKFSADNRYYRGEIVSVSRNQVEVFFIDYGNMEKKSIAEIYVLVPQFTHLPRQGIMCNLFGAPDGIGDDEMKNILSEVIIDVKILRKLDDVYMVELVPDSRENEKVLIQFDEMIASQGYSTPQVPKGVSETVIVTHVTDLNDFWCQLQTSNSQLNVLMEDMATFYKNGGNQDKYFIPKLGSPCVAMYSADDDWYRTVITGQTSDGQVEVQFVDYGNSELTRTNKVRVISSKYLMLPKQALNCSLFGTSEQVFSPEVVKKFVDLVLDNEFIAIFKDMDGRTGKMKVQLLDMSGNRIESENIVKSVEPPPKKWERSSATAEQSSFNWRDEQNSSEKLLAFNSHDDRNHSRSRESHNGWNTEKSENQKSRPVHDVRSSISKNTHCDWNNSTKDSVPENSRKKYLEPSFPNFTSLNVHVGSAAAVSVVHVVSPSEFYLHLIADESNSRLCSMMESLHEEYSQLSRDDCEIEDPSVGMPCCALFSEDKTWYRAKITAVTRTTITVEFVDYGNAEKLGRDAVKMLKPQYAELPSQAVRCLINKIVPFCNSWSNESVDKFKDMVLDKDLNATFVTKQANDSYEVDICVSENHDPDVIYKELVDAVHAKWNHAISLEKFGSNFAHKYTELNLSVDHEEEVEITWFVTPSELYCQLLSMESEFRDTVKRMQAFYNGIHDAVGIIDRPEPNVPCVKRFAIDGVWYRSRVVYVKGDRVGIIYVDYGNCEEVCRKELKYLTEEFGFLPAQGLKCSLDGIEFPTGCSTWPDISPDKVNEMFQGKNVCKFFKNVSGSYIVNLASQGISVTEKFISGGYAARTVDAVCIQFKEMLVPLNADPVAVSVVYVHSAASFFCQLGELSEEFTNLCSLMDEQEASSTDVAVNALAVGNSCLAKYSEDGSWYRGLVQSCQSDGLYSVLFVDYGNEEVVSVTEIRPVKKEYMQIPRQGIHCRLLGLAEDFSSELSDAFQNAVLEKENLKAVFRKRVGNIFAVSLLAEDQNVGELIFGSLSSEPEIEETVCQVFPKAVVALGDHTMLVSHVASPTSFFVQSFEQEEQLSALATSLDEIYKASEHAVPFEVTLGMACCSVYSADGCWYRAVVTDINGSDVTVRFIDYGNSETIAKESLRTVTEEFLSVPPFAVECQFPNAFCLPGKEQELFDGLNNKEVTVTFQSQTEPVAVAVFENDSDVLQGLIEAGIVSTKDIAQEIVSTKDIAQEIVPTEEVQSFPAPVLPMNEQSAFVVIVSSPSSFFVQLSSQEEALESLVERLDEMYKSLEVSSPSVFSLGMACCALYSEDGLWYRAVVTDIQETDLTVRFIDYGNSETIAKESLKTVTAEFLSIPPFAIECQFPGAECVAGKEQDFVDAIIQKEVMIDFKSKSQPVVVCMVENELDVLQGMVESGILVVVEYPEAKEALEEIIEAVLEPEELVDKDISPSEGIAEESMGEAQLEKEKETLTSEHVVEVVKEDFEAVCRPHVVLSESVNASLQESIQAIVESVCENVSSRAEVFTEEVAEDDNVSKPLTESKEEISVTREESNEEVMEQLLVEEEKAASEPQEDDVAEFTVEEAEVPEDILSYVDVAIPLGLHRVIVSHVHVLRGVVDLFVQLCDQREQIDDLSQRLAKVYSACEGLAVSRVDLGMACCAKNSESEAWCRAKVVGVSSEECSELTVQFVDCGNTQSVTLENLRGLMEEFLSIPPFAIKCKLIDCGCACDQEENVISFLSNKTVAVNFDSLQVPVNIEFSKNNSDVVQELMDKGFFLKTDISSSEVGAVADTDVNVDIGKIGSGAGSVEALPEGFNVFSEIESISSDETISLNICEELVSYHILESKKANYEHISKEGISNSFPKEETALEETYMSLSLDENVVHRVVCIKSLSSFFVMPSHQQEQLNILNDSLQEKYAVGGNDKIKYLGAGKPCVSRCIDDGLWYRALVKSVNGDKVVVLFVDYGNEQFCSKEEIKEIDEEFLSIPLFVTECTLCDIIDSDEARVALEEIVRDKDISIAVISVGQVPVHVKVFLYEDGCDVSSYLCAKPSQVALSYSPVKPPLHEKCYVTVSCVSNPSEFWVQLHSFGTRFQALINDISEMYGNLSEVEFQLCNLQVGQPCMAVYSGDLAWHRGEIIGISEKIRVKFIDYGNEEEVDCKEIKEVVNEEFFVLPAQAVKCSLMNVIPLNSNKWNPETCEEFKLMVEENNKGLLAEFVQVTDGLAKVKLLDVGIDVGQLLVNRKLAIKEEDDTHQFSDLFSVDSLSNSEENADSLFLKANSSSSFTNEATGTASDQLCSSTGSIHYSEVNTDEVNLNDTFYSTTGESDVNTCDLSGITTMEKDSFVEHNESGAYKAKSAFVSLANADDVPLNIVEENGENFSENTKDLERVSENGHSNVAIREEHNTEDHKRLFYDVPSNAATKEEHGEKLPDNGEGHENIIDVPSNATTKEEHDEKLLDKVEGHEKIFDNVPSDASFREEHDEKLLPSTEALERFLDYVPFDTTIREEHDEKLLDSTEGHERLVDDVPTDTAIREEHDGKLLDKTEGHERLVDDVPSDTAIREEHDGKLLDKTEGHERLVDDVYATIREEHDENLEDISGKVTAKEDSFIDDFVTDYDGSSVKPAEDKLNVFEPDTEKESKITFGDSSGLRTRLEDAEPKDFSDPGIISENIDTEVLEVGSIPEMNISSTETIDKAKSLKESVLMLRGNSYSDQLVDLNVVDSATHQHLDNTTVFNSLERKDENKTEFTLSEFSHDSSSFSDIIVSYFSESFQDVNGKVYEDKNSKTNTNDIEPLSEENDARSDSVYTVREDVKDEEASHSEKVVSNDLKETEISSELEDPAQILNQSFIGENSQMSVENSILMSGDSGCNLKSSISSGMSPYVHSFEKSEPDGIFRSNDDAALNLENKGTVMGDSLTESVLMKSEIHVSDNQRSLGLQRNIVSTISTSSPLTTQLDESESLTILPQVDYLSPIEKITSSGSFSRSEQPKDELYAQNTEVASILPITTVIVPGEDEKTDEGIVHQEENLKEK